MNEPKYSDVVYNNIDVNEMTQKLKEHRDKILEDFSKAYLAETGALPSEVELCTTQEHKDGKIVTTCHFRKKQLKTT